MHKLKPSAHAEKYHNGRYRFTQAFLYMIGVTCGQVTHKNPNSQQTDVKLSR